MPLRIRSQRHAPFLIIGFVGPADEFDVLAAETQKVIDNVEWRDE